VIIISLRIGAHNRPDGNAVIGLDLRSGEHRKECGLTGAVPNRKASAKSIHIDRINKIYKMTFIFNLVNLVNPVKNFRKLVRVAAGTMIKAP
jgi:hypothetical protein